jgi:hypothetical protein
MNLGATQSASSLIYPLSPLSTSPGQSIYSPLYMRALSQFYNFFQQIKRDYSPQQEKEDDRLENYRKFQEKIIISPDKIIILPTQQEIPKDSKQAILLRTIDTLFRHHFDEKSQLSESQALTSRPLRDSQSATNKVYHHQLKILPPQSPTHLNDSQSKILSLPIELRVLIFNHIIDDWQSLGKLGMTCKNFYHIIQDPNCLKKLFELSADLFPSILNPYLCRSLLTFTGFHPLRFGQLQMDLKNEDLAIIARQGTHLESLSLLGNQFTPQGLADLLKHCPRLRSLEFYQCCNSNFDDYMTVVALFANQLEHLKISDCQISDQSLLTLSICAPHLYSFEYENNFSTSTISDYSLIPFFSRMSQLESIKLTGCPKVTQASLISYTDYPIASSDPAKTKGNQLRHLKFSHCGVTDTQLLDSLAKHCPNLESLELGFEKAQCMDNLDYKQASLLKIASECSNLRCLKISNCNYLSSDNLKIMLSHCHNLTQLELRGSFLKNFCFEDLSACNKLQHLHLYSIEPVDFSRHHLTSLKKCPQLETLALINCQLDENNLLSYLRKVNLKRLQLINCGTFGSPLLMTLAQSSPSLESLEIEMSEQPHPQPFDDTSIKKLAQNCPSLNMLTLKSSSYTPKTNNWQFSALSLQHLAHYCTHLNQLTISHLNLLPSTQSHLSVEKIEKIIDLFTKRCLNITHLGLPAIQATNKQVLSLILPYKYQLSGLYLANNLWLDLPFLHQLSACSNLLYLWLKETAIESHRSVLSIFSNLYYLSV